ncbi:MAG: hypothetical protein FWH40_07055, partial [Coriobacteriia bacterium]|nr:hypothetical protein [Coriobacteriia bacterium]
ACMGTRLSRTVLSSPFPASYRSGTYKLGKEAQGQLLTTSSSLEGPSGGLSVVLSDPLSDHLSILNAPLCD